MCIHVYIPHINIRSLSSLQFLKNWNRDRDTPNFAKVGIQENKETYFIGAIIVFVPRRVVAADFNVFLLGKFQFSALQVHVPQFQMHNVYQDNKRTRATTYMHHTKIVQLLTYLRKNDNNISKLLFRVLMLKLIKCNVYFCSHMHTNT